MESQRLILFFVFAFSLFMLFDAWQRDRQPAPVQQAPSTSAQKDAAIPPPPTDKLVPAPAPAAQQPAGGVLPAKGATVKVETDVLRAEISTVGGDLRRLELKQHRAVEDKTKNFVLLEQEPDHVYVA